MSFGPVVRSAHEGEKGSKDFERPVSHCAPHRFTCAFPSERLEQHDHQRIEQIIFRVRLGRRNVSRVYVAFETSKYLRECVRAGQGALQ
jgi:hypothetical protein